MMMKVTAWMSCFLSQELTGLIIEEGVPSTGKVSAITITEPSHHPIRLEKGQLLGHMYPTQLVETTNNSTPVKNASEEETQVCSVSHGTDVLPVNEERQHELLQLLQNDRWGLMKRRSTNLCSLLTCFMMRCTRT